MCLNEKRIESKSPLHELFHVLGHASMKRGLKGVFLIRPKYNIYYASMKRGLKVIGAVLTGLGILGSLNEKRIESFYILLII